MSENLEKFEGYVRKRIKTSPPMGAGSEKEVFPHPHSEQKVVGIYHAESDFDYEKSPEYMRGKFYLTKILHILFPSNIPDIHMTTTSPRTITRQKLGLSSEQPTLPERYALIETFNKLGIFIDVGGGNIALDKHGNVVYFDDFYPWMSGVNHEQTIKEYDSHKLREYIQEHLPEEKQKRALGYLDRLESIAESAGADNPQKDEE